MTIPKLVRFMPELQRRGSCQDCRSASLDALSEFAGAQGRTGKSLPHAVSGFGACRA